MDHAEVRRIRLMARLLSHARVDEATGCWLWALRLNNQGYGTINVRVAPRAERRSPVGFLVHRVACEIFNGPPPTIEHEAAHDPACPHRHCIRPEHLRWATRTENEADKRHPSRLKLREVPVPRNLVSVAA
jgi:hypothetical protein